jgi:hypothetical protein
VGGKLSCAELRDWLASLPAGAPAVEGGDAGALPAEPGPELDAAEIGIAKKTSQVGARARPSP